MQPGTGLRSALTCKHHPLGTPALAPPTMHLKLFSLGLLLACLALAVEARVCKIDKGDQMQRCAGACDKESGKCWSNPSIIGTCYSCRSDKNGWPEGDCVECNKCDSFGNCV